MKKLIALTLSVLMIAALFTGCGSTETAKSSDVIKVAIVQQLDHSSLDEIRVAIEAEFSDAKYSVKSFNGQNDASMLNQIGSEIVADGYDIIIPIATMAAQCMVTAADGTDIPIVYAACSDPESAGLTGIASVTGVSDALNTPFILDMMLAAQPDVKTVGLLYSNSEINSATPIAEAKAYLDSKGIAYLEKTGNTSGEIITAVSDLVGRCEAVFTPTDNVVMAAEAAVAEILNNAGIPHYTGADSFVLSGAFTTCGVNYTELGTKTGKIALEILNGGAIGEFIVMDGGIITVNTDTAAAVGVDYSVFSSMANTVNEVTTTEE